MLLVRRWPGRICAKWRSSVCSVEFSHFSNVDANFLLIKWLRCVFTIYILAQFCSFPRIGACSYFKFGYILENSWAVPREAFIPRFGYFSTIMHSSYDVIEYVEIWIEYWIAIGRDEFGGFSLLIYSRTTVPVRIVQFPLFFSTFVEHRQFDTFWIETIYGFQNEVMEMYVLWRMKNRNQTRIIKFQLLN